MCHITNDSTDKPICKSADYELGKGLFMNVEETLKNIGTYWDIYSYLGTSERSLDEIKKHLMIECGKPESTKKRPSLVLKTKAPVS